MGNIIVWKIGNEHMKYNFGSGDEKWQNKYFFLTSTFYGLDQSHPLNSLFSCSLFLMNIFSSIANQTKSTLFVLNDFLEAEGGKRE